MQVVYVGQEPPNSFAKSIFLAGPTPRDKNVPSWRPEAIRLLRASGYDGVVFVPESSDSTWRTNYDDQIAWEEKYLHMADCILFWVPREMKTMPALTTNVEWGVWYDSGKVVFGAPESAEKVRYLQHYASKEFVATSTNLADTVAHAMAYVGKGAVRVAGEREVPLMVWNTGSFQQWYKNLLRAGNCLHAARVVWTFRVGPKKQFAFFWALHVDIFITSEGRHKTNEVVVARPDIATIVMYRRQPVLLDSEIILVREFRSIASNESGFVWEVPGGSTFKGVVDPKVLAADECNEEVGIVIDPDRIVQHEARQLTATLSAHRAHLFSVEIGDAEVEQLRLQKGQVHGVVEDTERTYTEVVTLREIMEKQLVDWSMLGMILSVLQK